MGRRTSVHLGALYRSRTEATRGLIFCAPMNKPNLKDGKPWSDADDDVLRSSVAKGTGLLEAAAVLCRSGTPFEVYKRGVMLDLWQEGGKRRANAVSQRSEPSTAALADREN